MSLRRLSENAPAGEAQGTGTLGQASAAPRPNDPYSNQVMPAGPGVDAQTILGPLIDGSFSQAQARPAIMAGVRPPQASAGTAPIRGTSPLPGTAPLGSQVGTGTLIGNGPPTATGAL